MHTATAGVQGQCCQTRCQHQYRPSTLISGFLLFAFEHLPASKQTACQGRSTSHQQCIFEVQLTIVETCIHDRSHANRYGCVGSAKHDLHTQTSLPAFLGHAASIKSVSGRSFLACVVRSSGRGRLVLEACAKPRRSTSAK